VNGIKMNHFQAFCLGNRFVNDLDR